LDHHHPDGSQDRVAFERYLDVLNQALGEVRHRFPYNHLVPAGERELSRRPVCVRIHDESSNQESSLIVQLDHGRFEVLDNCDPTEVHIQWRVRRSHIYDVITAPWSFMVDPIRFEFGFLLGLETPRPAVAERRAIAS
jgi:hypothetical protein